MILLVLSLQVFPTHAYSAKSPEDTGLTYECWQKGPPGGPDIYGNCEWRDLVDATKTFINKIVLIVLELSVFIIAWAGYKYMISGGNPGERKAANKMLLNVVKGIAIIMLAWLLVNLIAKTLLDKQIVDINIISNGK